MGVIFDTSVIIAVERDRGRIEDIAREREEEPFGISAITAAELLHGVERADTESRRLRRGAFVEKVLDLFPVYPFDMTAARTYARLWASLARKGISIGSHDLIIAASAIALGFTVVTFNMRDFGQIEGLRVERVERS
jgi:tRNA(fMet)-specific endonuclease VapC